MIDPNAPSMPSYAIYNEEGGLVNTYQSGSTTGRTYGLTIRQQFAMAAMQGMCGNLTTAAPDELLNVPKNVASWSVKMADALIAELNPATE